MKIWVLKTYGISDCNEFCEVELFKDKESAEKRLNEKSKSELEEFKSWNNDIKYNYEDCSEGDILITSFDGWFSAYIFGYGVDYTVVMELIESEVK